MIKRLLIGIVLGYVAYQLQNIIFGTRQTIHPDRMNASYHYIIIGAGSAGSVVASRLSEDPTKSVLLLEAGEEETSIFYSHIPGATPYLARTVYDWAFKTEPQTQGCHAMDNRQSYWPRGRGLGGTSVLNWMVYVRGNPADFDRWEELGNPGWSYKDVLPYFMRAETTEVEDLKNSPIHGHTGPLHISQARKTFVGEAFLSAAAELGIEEGIDCCGIEVGKFSRFQYFAHNGIRQSVVRKYLRPAMHRPNLHVITNAVVTKILFTSKSDTVKATGVQFDYFGKVYKVQTLNEVILSAGSVKSPHILMLSGVGPLEELKHHNIPVVVNSPAVGRNLDDHLALHFFYSVNISHEFDYELKFTPKNLIKSIPQYLFSGTGPFAQPPLEMGAFFKTGLTTKHNGPDLQLFVSPCASAGHAVDYLNYKQEIVDIFNSTTTEDRTMMTFLLCLLHPHNVGEIRLRSNDPFDHPSINPMYFHNDKDDKILAEGLKMIMAFMSTTSMAKYDPQLMEKPMPGCNHLKFLSDKYLLCIAKHRAYTLYHPIGTCRMGSDKTTSVVDSHLRVHGVKGLRVVDASVFPDQTSGNTNAPTIMVAEKASDIIKNDNNK